MHHNLPNWFCAQIGAREHYAIPRAIQQQGMLKRFYTDFWAGNKLAKFLKSFGSQSMQSLGCRCHEDLWGAAVTAWNLRSVAWEVSARRGRCLRVESVYDGFVEFGRRFSTAVRDDLSKRFDTLEDTTFLTYDTGALETLQYLRGRGPRTIVCQMDPSRVEVELVRQEQQLWPDWEERVAQVPEKYFQRREHEWALADRVVVNSEFCRRALVQQGVPPEKLSVVPLCYEPESKGRNAMANKSRAFDSPLHVLFLGQVILRKGIQYLMKAARLLEEENVRFDVVGPVRISREALNTAPKNMLFHGRVAREEAAKRYAAADVFVLPTISDGFAITQIEAMAHGLPVVATRTCGEVVSHGVDGFLVEPRDSEVLAATLLEYVRDASLLRAQSQAASQKALQFSLAALAERLLSIEAKLVG